MHSRTSDDGANGGSDLDNRQRPLLQQRQPPNGGDVVDVDAVADDAERLADADGVAGAFAVAAGVHAIAVGCDCDSVAAVVDGAGVLDS